MSSEMAIKAEGLSKSYQLYDRPDHRFWQSLFRHKKTFYREFWALQAVGFEVPRGTTYGIVGQNGSGKTTLLAILSGILKPTSGSLEVNGRVAPLLELGAGFNPNFTGRENVYFNAAVLGLSHDDISARFDDIAAFADIGEYLEQPVRTYSNGMYLRLAFAVATSVDADILVIDEILAVGDEAFQRKCFARIEGFKDAGGTILLASHSTASIVNMCDNALLLDRGDRLLQGAPKTVISYYRNIIYSPPEHREAVRNAALSKDQSGEALLNVDELPPSPEGQSLPADAPPGVEIPVGSDEEYMDPGLKPLSTLRIEPNGAVIEGTRLSTEDGREVNTLLRGGTYYFEITARLTHSARGLRFHTMIKTMQGLELTGLHSHVEGSGLDGEENSVISVTFPFKCCLLPGIYALNCGVTAMDQFGDKILHRIFDVVLFRVSQDNDRRLDGIVDIFAAPPVIVIRDSGYETGIEKVSEQTYFLNKET